MKQLHSFIHIVCENDWLFNEHACTVVVQTEAE